VEHRSGGPRRSGCAKSPCRAPPPGRGARGRASASAPTGPRCSKRVASTASSSSRTRRRASARLTARRARRARSATSASTRSTGTRFVTTGGGGMLVSRVRAALVARAHKLATQAREPASHYEHAELGFNYRMSNVLAGIGRAQLRKLPAQGLQARRRVFDFYRKALRDLPGVSIHARGTLRQCLRAG
jgi:hypothetical protein